jgi:hypothetical protein
MLALGTTLILLLSTNEQQRPASVPYGDNKEAGHYAVLNRVKLYDARDHKRRSGGDCRAFCPRIHRFGCGRKVIHPSSAMRYKIPKSHKANSCRSECAGYVLVAFGTIVASGHEYQTHE